MNILATPIPLAGHGVASEPTLLVGLGRGRVGKTTVLRWAVDRALAQGREPLIADGDARNPSLSACYAEATRPLGEDAEDVKDWLAVVLNDMAEAGRSAVLDLGGGDRALAEFGRDLDLVAFCADFGIRPVAVHVIGPHADDLRHVSAIEESGHFRPERTVLAMNEALAGSNSARAFEMSLASPTVKMLESRGARVVFVPKLACMTKIVPGIGFHAAAAPDSSLGPVERTMIRKWLRDMDGPLGFGPVAGWLP